MTAQKVTRQGPVKITRSIVDTAWKKRAPASRLVLGDAECRGLALVVNARSMSWRFEYRPRGLDPFTGKRFASRSIVLGNPASLSPDEARAAANKIKGEAKSGSDPAANKRAKLAADALARAVTLQRLLELYGEALPHRPKMRGGKGKLSNRAVAGELSHASAAVRGMNCMDKSASATTANDVKRMLEAVSEKPATARHRFGALSRLYDWAQEEGYVSINPCLQVTKVKRPKPPEPRHTFHTVKQLAQLWYAISTASGVSQVQRDLLQFLITVPCRRGEATKMQWSDLDLRDAVWWQRGTTTKNGEPHRFSLPDLALAILGRRREAGGMPTDGFVFPAPRSGREIDTFGKAKRSVSDALPVNFEWRIHDHRRSFVTALAEKGIHEAVLDSILNHKQAATRSGVLGVYQKAQRWPEQVKAMSVWNGLLTNEIAKIAKRTGG